MRKQLYNTVIIVFAIGGAVLSGTVHAKFKCWTNNEGVKECGNKVPPEFAQQGYEELGESGLVKDKVERVKTDEELAATKKLEKQIAEQKKRALEQKKQDEALLSTFGGVEDIERVRDERLATLKTSIKFMRTRNEKIKLKLDNYTQKLADIEKTGKTPPEALLQDIDSLKKQMADNEKFIEGKRAEQEDVKQSHAKDIVNFKRLKGIK